MPEVRCAVSNCYFWENENYCQASSIIVKPETQSFSQAGNDSFENSIMNGVEIQSTISTSSETCCQTFRPRHV